MYMCLFSIPTSELYFLHMIVHVHAFFPIAGRFDEAIEDLSHTLKLDPCFEQAKIGLDRSLQDKQEQSERQKMEYFDS